MRSPVIYSSSSVLLSLLLLLLQQQQSAAAAAIKVTIPSNVPASASNPLNPALASLSIELSYFTDFAGNLTHPNQLFASFLRNIHARTSKNPDIRPGGITADSTWFSPTAAGPAALIRDQSASGGIYRTTVGPSWYDSFKTLPSDIIYTIDLNLGNNSLANTTVQAASALKYLPRKQIFSFELGNEPDHFPRSFDQVAAAGGRQWDMTAYSKKYLNWTSEITKSLLLLLEEGEGGGEGEEGEGAAVPKFGAGTFADDPPTGGFNITGILSTTPPADANGLTNSYSQHMYQYSTCDPLRNTRATLPHLVSHSNITAYIDLWLPQIAASRDHSGGSKPFTVGEYNSVSCSGKLNVTDTFGQALWIADTTLWAAYRGVSQLFLHQGATLVFQSSSQANVPGYSKYNLIVPQTTDATGPARLTPGYVGYLLLAEAIGRVSSSGKSKSKSKKKTTRTTTTTTRIAPIEVGQGQDEVAVYGIWERTRLVRAVVLNMRGYNSTNGYWDWKGGQPTALVNTTTTTTMTRGGVTLEFGKGAKKVKRMTSTGMNEKNPRLVTWAGQEYFDGTPSGVEKVESVGKDGRVVVNDSEGVVVFFK